MKSSVNYLILSSICALGCAAKTSNNANPLAGLAGTTTFPSGSGGVSGGVAGTVGGTAGTSVQVSPTAGASGHPGTAGTGATSTAGTGAAGKGTGTSGTGAAGAAGTGSAGTGTSGTGAAGTSGSGFKPPCLKTGNQLTLVGDSYINYQENLAPRLAMRAVKDGALMQGDSYDDRAVAGTSLASGVLLIPPQWTGGNNTNTKFVVMDGGGNDVLLNNTQCLSDGASTQADCMQVVANSLAAGMQLIMEMKAAGVKQVLYFFYPNIPKDPGGHEINDYAIPMVKSACEGASDANFQCYFLDTRPILTDLTGDFNPFDQIHPSAQGDEKLADAVWALMKDHCMAQGDKSECCTP